MPFPSRYAQNKLPTCTLFPARYAQNNSHMHTVSFSASSSCVHGNDSGSAAPHASDATDAASCVFRVQEPLEQHLTYNDYGVIHYITKHCRGWLLKGSRYPREFREQESRYKLE